jgi:hypothetical protein
MLALPLALGAIALGSFPALAQTPELLRSCVLAKTPLGRLAVSAKLAPFRDRGIKLGGLSDLWRNPSDPPDEFWTITDRGPNASVEVAKEKRRTFPTPEFTPMILRLRVKKKQVEVAEAIPLLTLKGKPVTGRPNRVAGDEVAFTFDGASPIPLNPNGLDTEGLVRADDGHFWLAEEYAPSIVKVDATGHVLKRFVPVGVSIPGAECVVVEALPAVYARREANRGFEGLALDLRNQTLFAVMESPLENPKKHTAKESANVRLLAFDTRRETTVAEFIYRFESPETFDAESPHEIKIGAIVSLGVRKLLVLEHTTAQAKIFLVEFGRVDNLLGDPLSLAEDEHSLEATADLAAAGRSPLRKTLIADLSHLKGVPPKLEGLAVVDRQTIAVLNDNDFGFKGFDEHGNAIAAGEASRLLYLRLSRPLP